jgi:NADH-ubiquinone oxidoreductase chain 5
MGKSAQLGLHTWLPDAMEGPTPVSALIHAATMVTAGVFLLARCSYLFEFSELCLSLIMFVGATTAFFASTTGLFQNDIKKVIAYSTCSQLGYMVFACGLSSYDVGVFHLSNHAFFKALLFLGAGSVIHAVSDEQDMRKMGGLQNLLPFSYSTMLIGSLALVGFPFLAGFYSKDTILEIAFSNQTVLGHYCYYMGSFAAFFTAFYSTRLLFLVFLSTPNGNKKNILNAHEGSYYMTIPLFLLAILSIVIGYLTKEIFIGFGSDFWSTAVFILPKNYSALDIEFISLFNKLMPLFLTILGAFFAYNLYVFNVDNYFIIKQNKNFKIIFNFLNKKWYFDRLYNQFISANILHYSFVYSYSDLDRGVIEIVGPSGVILNVNTLENKIQSLQTGNIFDYLFLITLLSFLILFIIVSFQYFNIQFFVLLLIIFFLCYF